MRTGVIVLLLGVGIVVATPVSKSETVPLAGIKLVTEQSVPPSEVAASAKNGNKNGNKGAHQTGFATADSTWFGRERTISNSNSEELVSVDIR